MVAQSRCRPFVGSLATWSTTMPFLTLKVMASLLQLHGPGASIQSDHPGIDALLGDLTQQGVDQAQQGSEQQRAATDEPVVTEAYFRRGGFVRGPGYGGFRRGGGGYYGGGFRRAGYVGPGGGFRRGGFVRGY